MPALKGSVVCLKKLNNILKRKRMLYNTSIWSESVLLISKTLLLAFPAGKTKMPNLKDQLDQRSVWNVTKWDTMPGVKRELSNQAIQLWQGQPDNTNPPKCSTAQAEVEGNIHGRSFLHLFWLSSSLSQMYFCCIFTRLLNVILRPSVKIWDWTSPCCCCCCFNEGCCRVLVCK